MSIHTVSSYFIAGLLWRKITPADLIAMFDGDLRCYERFPVPDDVIMRQLIIGGDTLDYPTFNAAIGESGQARMVAINQSVLDVQYSPSHMIGWAAEIETDWKRRAAIKRLAAVNAEICAGDIDQVLLALAADLQGIALLSGRDMLTSNAEVTQAAINKVNALVGLGDDAYIETGYPEFDDEYYGLERGKITALGGDPGSGKTAWALKATSRMADDGQVVLWLHEVKGEDMSYHSALQRQASVTTRQLRWLRKQIQPIKRQLDRAKSEAEKQKLQHELDKKRTMILSNHHYAAIMAQLENRWEQPIIYKRCAGMNAIKLAAAMQAARAQFGRLDVVVIDHIQLFEAIKKTDGAYEVRQRYQELNQHVLGQFPETAILALQHLNKDIQRVYKGMVVPTQKDFAYGGDQDIDAGFIIVRDEMYKRQLDKEEWCSERRDRAEQGDEIAKQELADFERRAFLWAVKVREGKSGVGMRYEAWLEYFDFREA